MMYSLVKNPVLAAALSSSANDRGSRGTQRLSPGVQRPLLLPAAPYLPPQQFPATTTETFNNGSSDKAQLLPLRNSSGTQIAVAAEASGSAGRPSLSPATAWYSHAPFFSRPPGTSFSGLRPPGIVHTSVVARGAPESSISSSVPPRRDIFRPVEALPSPVSSPAAGSDTPPASHGAHSFSSFSARTPREYPIYSHLMSFVPVSFCNKATDSSLHSHHSLSLLPYAAFVLRPAAASTSATDAPASPLPLNAADAGPSIPAPGGRRWSPEKVQSQTSPADAVIAAAGGTATAKATGDTTTASAGGMTTARTTAVGGSTTAKVIAVGELETEVRVAAAGGRDEAPAAAPAVAGDHRDTAAGVGEPNATEAMFEAPRATEAATEEETHVTRESEQGEAAHARNEAGTDEARPPAAAAAAIPIDVAHESVINTSPPRLSEEGAAAEGDASGKDKSAATATAYRMSVRAAEEAWTAEDRSTTYFAGGWAAAEAGTAEGVNACLEEQKRWTEGDCLDAPGLSEADSKAAEPEEDASALGGGSPMGIAKKTGNGFSFLRGDGEGEWTDDGGNEKEEDMVFTGNSDALFFPAFPVHRCRGLSLWDVETNERVCLGKFEETAGLVLLAPEMLAKLALSFRTPFFDGVVLRSFIAPPGNANWVNPNDRRRHHRHPPGPSEHSATRRRSTSAIHARGSGSRRSPATEADSASAAVVGRSAVVDRADETGSRPEQRVAAASPSPSGIAAPAQALDAVTDMSTAADFVSATEGDPEAVHTRRRAPSDKRQRQSKQRAGNAEDEPAAGEELEHAVPMLPRTDQTPQRSSAAERNSRSKKEDRGAVEAGYRERQRPETAFEATAADASSISTGSHHVAGQPSPGGRRRIASPLVTDGGGVDAEAAAEVISAQTNGPATAGGDEKLASSMTRGRRTREGLDERLNIAAEREAERAEIRREREFARPAGEQTGRYTRRGKGQPPVSNASGRAFVTGPREVGTETIRVLEGVLIDPEELLEAMAAKHEHQQPHASVDGQWMRFERPLHDTDYKLCIGESYWMAMKIPLEACNPFLLDSNDVVVDLIDPQEQQQFPNHAAEEATSSQRRQSPPSGMAADEAEGHQPERRGGLDSPVRSRTGIRAEPGEDTRPADNGNNPSGSNTIPPASHAGNEDEVEITRPRTFTGWLGNRVYDRLNRITANAPAGLTNAMNRLVDSLPTTPEEAEDLGKKWSEQSLRAGRAIFVSAKLLMKSFKHAAAELWFFITEGRNGSGSTGG